MSHKRLGVGYILEMTLGDSTCLVVDDNAHTRALLQMILRDCGVRDVHLAENAEDGLAALHRQKFDAVLTDYEMAGVSGVEFIRRIRRSGNSAIRKLPVIMVTAHAQERRVSDAREAGVTSFVVKPLIPQQIAEKLNAALLATGELTKADGSKDAVLASKAMQDLKDRFEALLVSSVAEMQSALFAIGAHPSSAASEIERVFGLAHDLQGLGNNMDYPLITDLATLLCNHIRDKAEAVSIAAAGACIAGMDTVTRHKIKGQSEAGARLVRRVRALTAAA